MRPFRFSVAAVPAQSRDEWIAYARKVEALGYSMIVSSDHPAFGGLGPIAAIMAAADATSTLRFGGYPLNNDLRHPAMLAQEALTLDLFSGGRFELGLGAGWATVDYHALGIPFERGRVRLERLAESVVLIKQLLSGGPVTFAGQHYRLEGLDLQIPLAQRPRMPLFVGGSRQRILTLAAREADSIGLDLRSQGGQLDLASYTTSALEEMLAWVHAAAGERIGQIELHTLVHFAMVTEDGRAALAALREQLAGFQAAGLINNVELSDAELLSSPHVLIGTHDQIIETLHERRERYGISHITLFGGIVDDFTPVVEQLAGR
jgi:probable F420-dependent oxidoreductase